MFPSRTQWRSWSLPSKLTAVGVLVGIVSLAYMVLTSEMPLRFFDKQTIDDTPAPVVEQIAIPILIRNELRFDIHIDPGLEFFLLRPETPLVDHGVEAGIVRLDQPFGITTINGNYAISPFGEMRGHFMLPKSRAISDALLRGGHKLRVVVTNRWVDHYSEIVDVLFDRKTVREGIRVTFFKE